jgi:hypothetical protein
LNGKYRILENGIVVAEQSNLITTAGRRAILRFLSKRTNQLAGAIAVGIDTTAANIADKSLGFELVRANVAVTSADFTNNSVIFKTTIPANLAGKINEVGIWTTNDGGNATSKMLYLFDDYYTLGTITNGTFEAVNFRVGAKALKVVGTISTTVTASITNLLLDLSPYSALDEFALALHNTNATSIAIRFKTDASNYVTYTIGSPSAGYAIYRFLTSSLVTTGTPNLANITQIDLLVTSAGSAGTVWFDGLRVEDRDLNTDVYSLISRAILGATYTKSYGIPADVEYALDVT